MPLSSCPQHHSHFHITALFRFSPWQCQSSSWLNGHNYKLNQAFFLFVLFCFVFKGRLNCLIWLQHSWWLFLINEGCSFRSRLLEDRIKLEPVRTRRNISSCAFCLQSPHVTAGFVNLIIFFCYLFQLSMSKPNILCSRDFALLKSKTIFFHFIFFFF